MNDFIFLAMGGVKQADGSWCYPQDDSGKKSNEQYDREVAMGWDGREAE